MCDTVRKLYNTDFIQKIVIRECDSRKTKFSLLVSEHFLININEIIRKKSIEMIFYVITLLHQT